MKKTLSLLTILVLTACSDDVPPDITGVNPEVYKYKQSNVEQQIDNMPDWVFELPSDSSSIYSTGMGVAPDYQTSYDEAVLNAKSVLADRLNGELNSLTKTYRKRVGNGNNVRTLSEIETVSKNVVVDTNVSGYHVQEVDIMPMGTNFRTFVLLKFPIREFNSIQLSKLLQDDAAKSRILSKKAFEELDSEVEKKRNVEVRRLENLE